jgi:HAD superfamily hydrolase (TIGR01490 family)
MRLVIFDLDGTLIHASSERMFARYLFEHGCIGWRQVCAYALFVLRHAAGYRGAVFKKNKAYLTGLPRARVDELARRFVEERLLGTLYRPALARLESHRARGDTVLLLTGTPDFIARSLGERLGLVHIVATECAVSEAGVLTSAPPSLHPFGWQKLASARAFADASGLDLSRAAAYANARDDRFLLANVGEAVAVRPDLRLRGLARRAGWEIIEASM